MMDPPAASCNPPAASCGIIVTAPMIRRIETIDAHAAGEPLRLVVGGIPAPAGATMLDKRASLRRRRDRLRRALMHEPRGHAGMYGALLTEPVNAGSDAGVLFMHNEGYSSMCGHGIIAVVTIALERGLLVRPDAAAEMVLDTPAGPVRARPQLRAPGSGTAPRRAAGADAARPPAPRVERVSFANVPSFVLHGGLRVELGSRSFPVDVAFGGAFYAIVDAEAAGVPLRAERLADLRTLGMEIKHAVERTVAVAHPEELRLRGIYGTIFTGPPEHEEADLRNVTIFADAQVDRSPCGTGTAAVMAVLDALGLLGSARPFVHESLIGTRFHGTVDSRTVVGDLPAVRARIEGSAWITGEHTFLIDDDDPLRAGFLLQASAP